MKKLGRKGQLNLQGAMTIGYAFIIFIVGLFVVPIFLMALSDNLMGIYFYDYAVQYNANPTVLAIFELLRGWLPLFSLISMGFGFLIVAYIASVYS